MAKPNDKRWKMWTCFEWLLWLIWMFNVQCSAPIRLRDSNNHFICDGSPFTATLFSYQYMQCATMNSKSEFHLCYSLEWIWIENWDTYLLIRFRFNYCWKIYWDRDHFNNLISVIQISIDVKWKKHFMFGCCSANMLNAIIFLRYEPLKRIKHSI